MRGVAKLERGEGNVGILDVAEPEVIPDHVLIEVQAAGVCGTDVHIYHDEYDSNPPVIMGHEVAGTVAEVGAGVTVCQPGDRVTTETYFYTCQQCDYCRNGQPNMCPERKSIGTHVHGGFTRYVLVPARNIHHLPDEIDPLVGALTEPLTCCVHALEMTRVDPSETVVVSGPGAIGLLMAQVVKAAGARVVVLGTDTDESCMEMALSLGVDVTVNVQAEDPKQALADLTEGRGPDAVFECAGAAASAQTCLSLVRRRGRYAQLGLFGKPVLWDLDQVCFKELQVSGSFAHVPSAWRKALTLMASGQVQIRPLISAVLPISQWQQAFEMFERREGLKIVMTPEE